MGLGALRFAFACASTFPELCRSCLSSDHLELRSTRQIPYATRTVPVGALRPPEPLPCQARASSPVLRSHLFSTNPRFPSRLVFLAGRMITVGSTSGAYGACLVSRSF